MSLLSQIPLPGAGAIPAYWPVILTVAVAAVVGGRRGWVRELTSLGAILIAWLVVGAFGFTVIEFTNKVSLIARFTNGGGFELDEPGPYMRTLRTSPTIDPWAPDVFLLIVFVAGVIGAYVLGSRLAADRESALDSVFGVFAGGLNGFLVAYVASGFIGTARTGEADLSEYIAIVAVVAVVAVVLVAVAATLRGATLRSGRAGRPGGDG